MRKEMNVWRGERRAAVEGGEAANGTAELFCEERGIFSTIPDVVPLRIEHPQKGKQHSILPSSLKFLWEPLVNVCPLMLSHPLTSIVRTLPSKLLSASFTSSSCSLYLLYSRFVSLLFPFLGPCYPSSQHLPSSYSPRSPSALLPRSPIACCFVRWPRALHSTLLSPLITG
ncbi:uncharacterized protein MONOS_14439 [Monocercomonoides exilis]|uniref:uncharacterized protein n=1 Tax=Monocercomonoides exilis TaxID=2049356 RepID=UPI00355AA492|nr:hypothetical protein MONOS_14439 [Monocercomonoides exilis]|eukprot:MONOS_14439.1-p1 / transcript=MONOS_14439.1 / gene=MONOS_14439 / organism=Monocercomonoides_exilis_PA203 / gene_product=unspecified product / transcript_product=unspecified product / location=Mono_scaffold01002:4444-5205(+) / protein_length=171 / sequence_SO=supercontig / SO=protein_coding / is_pseudo=false